MTNAMDFKLIGYTYDPNSGDLRLVGESPFVEGCSVETIVHNPSPSILEHVMAVYSGVDVATSIDFSFSSAYKSRAPMSFKTTREELEKNINEYNNRLNTESL